MNNTDLAPVSISLRKGAILPLHDAVGQRLEVLTGTLWVTLDHDPRDIVLGPGEGLRVDHGGATLISAMEDASFVLLEPVTLHGS